MVFVLKQKEKMKLKLLSRVLDTPQQNLKTARIHYCSRPTFSKMMISSFESLVPPGKP